MAYYTHAVKPIGQFVEKEVGNYFEYSVNDTGLPYPFNFPHKIWVGDGYRLGTVKKTVAYIVTDEDEYGQPVIEKWQLKKNTAYAA